ncbi:ZIP family metal transporter [Limnohabitans sp. MMS-10A-178]|uniref:ZIP family metal transporter n=1 Tax=Limnohabitans sp. MMS-10A-178 TaxID=1835767 RepID=UPI000D3C3942|nr:ZIP family metal transporter [Limnohabitans sp. MMS-10A-178]PUE17029.1 ZIP family metal transporter [Limnohabitans sp. MMS-10A-178]
MTLLAILVGTLAAGIGSVWLAAWLSFGIVSRYTQHMLSLAAGALLATAFLHLLPEAFEAGVEPHNLFVTLLFGLLFFFLLDKAELWHHGHEHHHGDGQHDHHGDHHDEHDHHHSEHAHHHDHHQHAHHAKPVPGGWAILAGDSVHCFGDGILIASAFLVDLRLGIVAALAVLAHEVPHHMGDLVVLREGSKSRQTAVLKVSMAGAITALGGVAGFALLEQLHGILPYMLAIASSSFIYVALADLIPQLQRRLSSRETATQIVWLVSGIALVSGVSTLAHSFAFH